MLARTLRPLLGHLVGLDVVDADLQILKAGAVEPANALFLKIVAVGDDSGDHTAGANAGDDGLDVGMHHRLTTAQGDDLGAQRRQLVEPCEHVLQWNRIGDLVVFVAIRTRQVAPSHRYDLRQNGPVFVGDGACGHAQRAEGAFGRCGDCDHHRCLDFGRAATGGACASNTMSCTARPDQMHMVCQL